MTAPLAFVDTETTGLDPRQHEVWEVALILRDSECVETERVWQIAVDLGRADPVALSIGRFYERSLQANPGLEVAEGGRAAVTPAHAFAKEFAELTHGAHLVGAVPSFDDAFLKRLLRIFHQCPGWHYHLVDVEALAAGAIAAEAFETRTGDAFVEQLAVATPPWNSSDLSRAVGVDPDMFPKHTALGDARWAKAIFDAVLCSVQSTC